MSDKNNYVEKERIRETLLNYYTSKSQSHIGYSLTAALAFVGLSQGNLINLLGIHPITLTLCFLFLIAYFLGRAYYWTQLSTAVLRIKSYSINQYFEYNKGNIEESRKRGYELSELLLMHNTAVDNVKKIKFYKDEQKKYYNYLFDFFQTYSRITLLLIELISLIINYVFYFKIFQNTFF